MAARAADARASGRGAEGAREVRVGNTPAALRPKLVSFAALGGKERVSAAPRQSASTPANKRGKARHLQSVDKGPVSKAAFDRTYTPVYDDVLQMGVAAGPALLYHLLIRLQGDAEDGRRGV